MLSLRACPAAPCALRAAPRPRPRRVRCGARGGASFEERGGASAPACELLDGAKSAECWAGAAALTAPGSAAHARAEAELRFRGFAEAQAERLRARAAAEAASAAAADELRLEDADAPFPWLGGFTAQLYWCLARFGLSDTGVRARARRQRGMGPKRDIWVNEDGTVDFVDADAVASD